MNKIISVTMLPLSEDESPIFYQECAKKIQQTFRNKQLYPKSQSCIINQKLFLLAMKPQFLPTHSSSKLLSDILHQSPQLKQQMKSNIKQVPLSKKEPAFINQNKEIIIKQRSTPLGVLWPLDANKYIPHKVFQSVIHKYFESDYIKTLSENPQSHSLFTTWYHALKHNNIIVLSGHGSISTIGGKHTQRVYHPQDIVHTLIQRGLPKNQSIELQIETCLSGTKTAQGDCYLSNVLYQFLLNGYKQISVTGYDGLASIQKPTTVANLSIDQTRGIILKDNQVIHLFKPELNKYYESIPATNRLRAFKYTTTLSNDAPQIIKQLNLGTPLFQKKFFKTNLDKLDCIPCFKNNTLKFQQKHAANKHYTVSISTQQMRLWIAHQMEHPNPNFQLFKKGEPYPFSTLD